MVQAAATVIMPRRGFLTRALGFTLAGATVALPIITVDDARARASHHLKGLKKAMEELYPGSALLVQEHFPEGEYADPVMMSDRYLVVVKTERLPSMSAGA